MSRTQLPPLKALYDFSSAAAHLSFSKAAAELCVTASAVSHQVRLLERVMGVTLFQRLPRGLELTREGKALHQACETAFGGLSSAIDALSTGTAKQNIRIASVPHYSARILFPARLRFMSRFPQFNLIIDHTLDMPSFAEDGHDLAVLFGKGHWPGLEADLLFNSETGPACSPGLAKREGIREVSDIMRLPVLLDHSCFSDIWVDWFRVMGELGWENIRFVPCNDIHALLVAAADGYGLVMEPDFVIQEQLADGSLIRPFPKLITDYGYWLVYPTATMKKHACREFRSWLLSQPLENPEQSSALVSSL